MKAVPIILIEGREGRRRRKQAVSVKWESFASSLIVLCRENNQKSPQSCLPI